MRRVFAVLAIVFSIQFFALGQQDRLQGRWSGTVQGPQGQQNAVATFKKEGDKYTGSISGLRPGSEAPLQDVKLEGDKVTAKTEVETGQGTIVVNYEFALEGDTLKGKGEVNFGGQPFTFDFNLKRGGDAPAGPAGGQQQPPQQRPTVPQPQQKQSIDYFVGQWTFKYVGRESALGPAPREGSVTFTKSADGKSLVGRAKSQTGNQVFQENLLIVFDDSAKGLTFSEDRSNGVKIKSRADWSSPISIRFIIEPIKVKGQTLQLRRTISVVAAHSFTVTEELSEDGGPFVRLGSGVYSKSGS